jgi:hypothetical protein
MVQDLFIQNKDDFDKYMIRLKDKEKCRYMNDLELCNQIEYECKFWTELSFIFSSVKKKECGRPRMLKFKKML